LDNIIVLGGKRGVNLTFPFLLHYSYFLFIGEGLVLITVFTTSRLITLITTDIRLIAFDQERKSVAYYKKSLCKKTSTTNKKDKNKYALMLESRVLFLNKEMVYYIICLEFKIFTKITSKHFYIL